MYKIIGIEDVDFTSEKGDKVTGIRIYCSFEKKNVEGVATDKFFLSFRLMNNISYMPKLGDNIDILYNRYGKIASINVIE